MCLCHTVFPLHKLGGNGIKQGGVLVPRSSFFFSMIPREEKHDLTEGTYISFQIVDGVFNLRRNLALNKTFQELMLYLLLPDDYVLLAHM